MLGTPQGTSATIPFFPGGGLVGLVLTANLVAAQAKPLEVSPEHAQQRSALLEETVHGRAQGVGGDRIEFLEPTLDGRITTSIHVGRITIAAGYARSSGSSGLEPRFVSRAIYARRS